MSNIIKKVSILLVLICVLTGCVKEPSKSDKTSIEGSELLEGSWAIQSLLYNDKEYTLAANDSLAALYENIYLSFFDDGTFCYFDRYSYNGKYTVMKSGTFMLEFQTKRKIDVNAIVIEENTERYCVVTVLSDGRLRFAEMDGVTGAERTDEAVKVFSKQQ